MPAVDVRQATPGPWQISQKKRAGTSGQLLSLAEIPHYISANGQPVAGVWSRADAEFIVQARSEWPLLASAFDDTQSRLVMCEAERSSLNAALAERTLELDRLRPVLRDMTAMLARIAGIHSRGNDWALPWDEIRTLLETNGVHDWDDWTKW